MADKMVKCDRCRGKGEYTVRFAKAGQSTRVDGVVVDKGDGWTRHEGGGYSFAHIEWEDVQRGPFPCRPCLGTGWRKPRPPAPRYAHWDADGNLVSVAKQGEEP